MIPARNAPGRHTGSKMGICTSNGRGEHTEYGMNPDDVGEKCGSKENENGEGHEKHRWAVLDRARVASDPEKYFANDEEHEEGPSDADQQDPQGSEPTAGIYERNAEGEQCPSDDVVANSSRQDHYANGRVEQLELRQNAAQHGECRDRVRDAGEEHKMRVRNLGRIDKTVIEGNGKRRPKSERNGDSGGGDGEGETRIATDDRHVDFKTDDKEE